MNVVAHVFGKRNHHHELQGRFPLVSSFLYFIAFHSDFATSYIKTFQEKCKQGPPSDSD